MESSGSSPAPFRPFGRAQDEKLPNSMFILHPHWLSFQICLADLGLKDIAYKAGSISSPHLRHASPRSEKGFRDNKNS
jgi:hypothetical protein